MTRVVTKSFILSVVMLNVVMVSVVAPFIKTNEIQHKIMLTLAFFMLSVKASFSH